MRAVSSLESASKSSLSSCSAARLSGSAMMASRNAMGSAAVPSSSLNASAGSSLIVFLRREAERFGAARRTARGVRAERGASETRRTEESGMG